MNSKRQSIYLSVSSLILFSLTTILRNSFASLDMSVNAWATTVHTPIITTLAILISEVFEFYFMLIVTVLIGVYMFMKNLKKESIILMSTMFLVVTITRIIKYLTLVERPLNGLIESTGYAYPSGHVTGSMVFFSMLLYVFWGQISSNNNKKLLTILLILIALIVGFDRIYLNVHWLSDVIGGYLLGTFVISSTIYVNQNYGKIKEVMNKI